MAAAGIIPSPAPRRHWLLGLISRYFKESWDSVSLDDLRAFARSDDEEVIANRLIRSSARNAAILGAFTGILMSADEALAIATAGEGGLGLPVNILIAIFALTVDTIMLIRIQLSLVACLGRLYVAPLDPDDPADILTIFAYAAGGVAAKAAGKAGMKVGGKVAGRVAKSVIQKEAMSVLTRVSEKVGIRILQSAAIKYSLPVVSIGLGMIVNFFAIGIMGQVARRHMKELAAVRERNEPAGAT
jgi:hypothetical protein